MRYKLISTGLRYCIRHEGVADVDEDRCDFGDEDDRVCVLRQMVYRRAK